MLNRNTTHCQKSPKIKLDSKCHFEHCKLIAKVRFCRSTTTVIKQARHDKDKCVYNRMLFRDSVCLGILFKEIAKESVQLRCIYLRDCPEKK